MTGLRLILLLLAANPVYPGTVIDRIAIIVGKHLIKDSDIQREIRLTDFMNADPLDLGPAARRKAANRLIDQALIRNEMQLGRYAEATADEVDHALTEFRGQIYPTPAQFQAALAKYGVTEEQVGSHMKWQLSVLRFIDLRFRPGVLITDEDIQGYYKLHLAELTKQNGGKAPSLDEARDRIEDQLSGERVNQQFYAWLEESRSAASIQYRETELK